MKRIFTAIVLMGTAGGAYSADFGDLAVKADALKAAAGADGVAVIADLPKEYAKENVPAHGAPVEWVSIGGGKFLMGINNGGDGLEDARPMHEVAVRTFEMSKTAVTVEQYAECVAAGLCSTPGTRDYLCNWGKPGRQLHPVNCVDWAQADQYARFKGARLPSEAEWEYAATSGGMSGKYPWGNEEPTCDRAVMDGQNGYGCGKGTTLPVCSRPAGNTAQGLCDMAGNVWQWVQDRYQSSYAGAPVDGSAAESGSSGVIRGGSFYNSNPVYLRSGGRAHVARGYRDGVIGFRLAKSGR